MPNPYVNKVVQSNGTTLMDISDTTALAADVEAGKYFYLATGEKVEGTGSGGGGGMTTENIIPQQSLNCSIDLGDGAYGAIINTYTAYPQDGDDYLVTFDNVQYICRCHYRTSSILVVGDYYITAGTTYAEFPFAILLNGGSLFYLAVQGSAVHSLKVDKILSYSGGGGGSTLIEKAITANGTYTASNDSADGYSKVTVNVSGSSKNVQTAQSTTRRNNTALGSITSVICSKAGTYDVYWVCARSSTSGTWGSQLYINGTAYDAENTTFSNHVQVNHLSNVTIPAGATVAVYGRSRSGYYIYAPQLTIVEA